MGNTIICINLIEEESTFVFDCRSLSSMTGF